MRIGVFGGTFDPVHLGHLVLAEQCRDQARLDQVWFVPAARPPHKQDTALTPFSQRVEMLELALAGHAAFRIEQIEKDRPGPSFTVDTLEVLQRRDSSGELFLLLGSDSILDLPHWREPARIIELATLLIWPRPSYPIWSEESLRSALHAAPEVPFRLQVIHGPLIDISSRDLRQRVANGRTIRYLVPRAVQVYVENHRLYRSECEPGPA